MRSASATVAVKIIILSVRLRSAACCMRAAHLTTGQLSAVVTEVDNFVGALSQGLLPPVDVELVANASRLLILAIIPAPGGLGTGIKM